MRSRLKTSTALPMARTAICDDKPKRSRNLGATAWVQGLQPFPVTAPVDRELRKHTSFKAHTGGMGRRGVEGVHRLQHGGVLV